MYRTNDKLMADFMTFSRYFVRSRDIDPLYDVLKKLHDWMGLGLEQRAQHLMMYLACYNLITTQIWWENGVRPCNFTEADAKLPCATERRGHRDPVALMKHMTGLAHLKEKHGGFAPWLKRAWDATNPQFNWVNVSLTLMSAYGNGRWAAYKGCELLQKVADWHLAPIDMGHKHSSQPRHGLALLYLDAPHHDDQGNRAIDWLDRAGEDLLERMRAEMITVDIAEVETCCCDFRELTTGGYYVGHDIDQLQENIIRSTAPSKVKDQLLAARAATLPHAYLGEKHNWCGVDKLRNVAYRDHGKILVREI